MRFKHLAACALLLSTVACQTGNAAINPMASAYDSSTQRNYAPPLGFKHCRMKTQTVFVGGKVYVINALICEDDHGHTVIIT